MNAVSPITSSDIENPIRLLSTRELLAAMVGFHDELNRRGSLADAPLDLLKGLDVGDNAARELREWLS